MKVVQDCYTFDDILLSPDYSDFLPSEAKITSNLTNNIILQTPLISAAMDTVTESKMAIRLAQMGGIGCIHRNMSIEKQASEVHKVKKHESLIVSDPVTMNPEDSIKKAIELQKTNSISGIPVVCSKTNKLMGIVTNRDVRFANELAQPVSTVMTSDRLITVSKNIDRKESLKLLHKHRVERLIVIDEHGKCTGLITVKDMERIDQFPIATKDEKGRLRVSAAIGTAPDSLERMEELALQEVDVIVTDTAHGHSLAVRKIIEKIKSNWPQIQVIGGNVVTQEGASFLISAGVDGVKVGMGPGSICTTRIVTGAGVPQLSAIMDVKKECKKHGVPLIADGGIKNSGDIAKAIAAGADTVMLGSLLAGTLESPGEIILHQGRSYKSYRGMGSIGAMLSGSSDRYFQTPGKKLVPEGIEGMIPFKGELQQVVEQLTGGLRSAMGYAGKRDIQSMQNNCKFLRVTTNSVQEGRASNSILSLDHNLTYKNNKY